VCSHLVEELLKRRYRIIIFDDLSTGKLENITLLIEPSWHCEPFTSCHSERSEESPLSSGLS